WRSTANGSPTATCMSHSSPARCARALSRLHAFAGSITEPPTLKAGPSTTGCGFSLRPTVIIVRKSMPGSARRRRQPCSRIFFANGDENGRLPCLNLATHGTPSFLDQGLERRPDLGLGGLGRAQD